MCEPTTIAAIGLAVTVAGTAASAYGQYRSAQGQQAAAAYQAAVHRNNQIIAQQMAENALERGRIQEQNHRQKVAQVLARQETLFGAAGISLAEGTAIDVFGDTAEMGETDALTIRYNSEREAEAYLLKAQNAGQSAVLADAAGASISPGMAAGTTLLTGFGKVASQAEKFKFFKA